MTERTVTAILPTDQLSETSLTKQNETDRITIKYTNAIRKQIALSQNAPISVLTNVRLLHSTLLNPSLLDA